MTLRAIFDHIARLRDPQAGCPWDRKQTFQTFAECIESEARELADAMRCGDRANMREEAGDLLWTVAFMLTMAEEEQSFSMDDSVRDVVEKMRRRHPHVFGDGSAATPEEALASYRAAKALEKERKGTQPAASGVFAFDPESWFRNVMEALPRLLEGDAFAEAAAHAEDAFTGHLWRNVAHNARLWKFEDQVRRPDLPDAEIARLKRAIDAENQGRNDAIDEVDAAFVREATAVLGPERPQLPLNTETPGSVLDRIAIIALRSYHLQLEVDRADATDAHRTACRDKKTNVDARGHDLMQSLRELLCDIATGRKRAKCYNQHKLYNNPETNPAVREALKKH